MSRSLDGATFASLLEDFARAEITFGDLNSPKGRPRKRSSGASKLPLPQIMANGGMPLLKVNKKKHAAALLTQVFLPRCSKPRSGRDSQTK